MAQKVQVILTDDIDGSEAEETIDFAIDGVTYQIDLNTGNAEALREIIQPYQDAARRVGGRLKGPARRPRAVAAPEVEVVQADTQTVRAWAAANGYQVSDRGRIAGEVRRAFEAANV